MNKRNWKYASLVTGAALIISLASHLFLIGEWLDGRYFTGSGDGLSQMLPFKQMLYDQYSKGEFFYNEGFGLGGGTYSQLGYYYATSIVFWIQCGITYLFEITGLINHPDLFYWANIILVASTLRLAAILIASFCYFRYMKFSKVASLLAAAIYGTSIIYFRHIMYWDFFADAMLWLPLLLLGAERIIRRGQIGLFTVMVGISLFDNFYFAYVNFLLGGIYIVIRFLVRADGGELGWKRQLWLFVKSGLIGFLISAVSFIPSAYGYLNNERPPFKGEIPLFEMPDNLLLSGRVILILAFTVFCLFLFSFYRNKKFRFFAILVILGMIMHLSPMVASMFNGFSAPQYRWEYFLGFAAGGLAAAGLDMLDRVKWQQMGIAFIGAGLLYYMFYRQDENMYLLSFEDWRQSFLLTGLAIVYVALIAFFLFKNRPGSRLLLAGLLIAISVGTAYEFQVRELAGDESKRLPTESMMKSEKYIGSDQVALIRKIQEAEKDSHARIDWMIPTRNNTPIVEQFLGMSVYSSILNKHLLRFYLDNLQIDMKRESVSRYATMGGRANLYALTNGKYMLIKKGEEATVPYGFKKIAEKGSYAAYRNQNMLPFMRTTSRIYSKDSLEDGTMLEREHAMLDGVILDKNQASDFSKAPKLKIEQNLSIKPDRAVYDGKVLKVKGKTGGIDINVKGLPADVKDLYVSFHLERLVNTSPHEYQLSVNDYHTLRKANTSIYRTFADDLTIRIPREKTVSIRLPKGSYTLSNLVVQGEDYSLLRKTVQSKGESPGKLDWNGGSTLRAKVNNGKENSYLILPVPFEKGWQATVNGKKRPILQANYAFTALPLENGSNKIELHYRPPYFLLSLLLSVIGIILACFDVKRSRKSI
ncbi:YfhO family protein [Aciduricibacillus chroicocephali]|uniref:YfhO family protein n=1 Tax=Aciduricibacillus chroicocephali TaxID=3054939 RepID=A0ABY9KTK8_9BACI|nr:YfhO family protein [Bacillaceae bacterium 44XB]